MASALKTSALLPLLVPTIAHAVDWTATPSLRLGQTYTDNVGLAPAGQAHGDLGTELVPAIAIAASAGQRLQFDIRYALRQVSFQHRSDHRSQQLDAGGHAELLPDWLYLDAQAGIDRQQRSTFGPRPLDPVQTDADSITVRIRRVSPYLRHELRGLATATLRYDLQQVSGSRLTAGRSEAASLSLVGARRGGSWGWKLNAERSAIDDGAPAPIRMTDVALTLGYPIRPDLELSITDGRENKGYHADGHQPAGRYRWAGASWTPSPRTRIAASAGQRYFGNTFAFDAAYRMRSMLWKMTYDEDITTTQAQFFRVTPPGLADFLHQLWASRIPDPLQRRQHVQAFLQLSQLLGADGTVNLVSRRYYLQKSLRLASVYSGTRGALALNLSRVDRTAQTSAVLDSAITGPDRLALEDRTRQRAIQLGWTRQLSPRASLGLGASHHQARSLSTARVDRNSVVSLQWSHRLSPGISAEAHLRHNRHTSIDPAHAGDAGGGNYRENGVGAAVTAAF